MAETKTKTTKTKEVKKLITGTGRRKSAVASCWLKEEKGEIMVNGKKIADYFSSIKDTSKWVQPFHAIGVAHPSSKYDLSIRVKGGGISAQMDAITLAIAKAILASDASHKPVLKQAKLLTTDARRVERKKPNLHKARKAEQFSKR